MSHLHFMDVIWSAHSLLPGQQAHDWLKLTPSMQALTTGNLDQAPPELRDVLVPLHVRALQACRGASCMHALCMQRFSPHVEQPVCSGTIHGNSAMYAAGSCIIWVLTALVVMHAGGYPGQGRRGCHQGGHAGPHWR
jgi:hypothetical protein